MMVVMASTATAARHRPHRPPERCKDHLRQAVVANAQALVYRASVGGAYAEFYGCVYGRRGTTDLGPAQDAPVGHGSGPAYNVRLAGHFAALEFDVFSTDFGPAERLETYDVRRGRIVRSIATGQLTPAQMAWSQSAGEPKPVGVGPTRDLLVTADGALAWIVYDNIRPDPPTLQVWKADAGSDPMMLAAGNDIAVGSLAVSGGVIYWTQAATPHSASLR